jgi:hypothetical protein
LEPGDFFLFKIIAKELFRNYMFWICMCVCM